MSLLTLIPTPFLLQELQRRGAADDDHDTDAALPPVVLAVTQAVADTFRVAPELLLGRSRLAHIAKARFAAWLLLSDQGLTRRQIALAFRRRDTGTIRHGCIRGRVLIRQDKSFTRALHEALRNMKPLMAETAGKEEAMPA